MLAIGMNLVSLIIQGSGMGKSVPGPLLQNRGKDSKPV